MSQRTDDFNITVSTLTRALHDHADLPLEKYPELIKQIGLPAEFTFVVIEAGALFKKEPIARIEFDKTCGAGKPAVTCLNDADRDTIVQRFGSGE